MSDKTVTSRDVRKTARKYLRIRNARQRDLKAIASANPNDVLPDVVESGDQVASVLSTIALYAVFDGIIDPAEVKDAIEKWEKAIKKALP